MVGLNGFYLLADNDNCVIKRNQTQTPGIEDYSTT